MTFHVFYQHLPNKLDSLEKIPTWYYGDRMKNNPYWSDTYLLFTEGSVIVLSGQRAVKGASLSATYSAKGTNKII